MPFIPPTKTFPWLRIWLKLCMNAFDSTYVQHWTFTNTPTDSNTHAHGLTHTHIYVRTQKHSVTDSKFPFLSFLHQLLNVFASTNPNPKPNPSCLIYTRQQNLTLTLTLTLTKNAQEIAQIKKISDYGFRYNIFSDKTHDHTPFKNSIADSWFLTSHSLTFNPACATRKLLPSAGTRSNTPSFYFVKRVKPKSTVIHSRLQNMNHSCLAIYTLFLQTAYLQYTKNSPYIIQISFQPLFKIRPTDSLIKKILPSDPHIFKRAGSWTTSLSLYLEPVLILLDLLPANFQFTVTLSSCMD